MLQRAHVVQYGLTCGCDADHGDTGVEASSPGPAGSEHSAEHDPGEVMTLLRPARHCFRVMHMHHCQEYIRRERQHSLNMQKASSLPS